MTFDHLIISDGVRVPTSDENYYINWNGYSESANEVSLLAYIETHSDRLKSKFLKWIHDLGNCQVNETSVTEHLTLEEGFSYWWMTLLTEKSIYKSPFLFSALKLLAIEEIVIQHSFRTATVKLEDSKSVEVLTNFFSRNGLECIDCQISSVEQEPDEKPLRTLFSYLKHRWSFRQKRTELSWKDQPSLFICSFFFHLNKNRLEQGQFYTNYWENLHELTKSEGLNENWLHLFYAHPFVENAQDAMDKISALDDNSFQTEAHHFLDMHLDYAVLLRAYKNFSALKDKFQILREFTAEPACNDRALSLWPLFKSDWTKSMTGATAMENMIWFALLEKAVSNLPTQELGIYLCENQPWERALIHLWRKHGHGVLVGVPHSSVRYWDLRYFSDVQTYFDESKTAMPVPDFWAVNSPGVLSSFKEQGISENKLVPCEALRFGHLINAKNKRRKRLSNSPMRLLLLGDYDAHTTVDMLQLIAEAKPQLTQDLSVSFKPHPNLKTDLKDYLDFPCTVEERLVGEIVSNFDVVLSSNSTTASIDAYLSGLQVFVMLDRNNLNFNPLRGFDDVYFVASPRQFVQKMGSLSETKDTEPNTLFYLDPEFPKWKSILQKNFLNN